MKRRARPAARPTTSAPRRSSVIPAAVLLAVTGAVKLTVAWQLHDHPLLQPSEGLDSEVYFDLARRVASGDLALGAEPFFVAPLYAYVLGLFLAVSDGSLLFARGAQALLGTCAVALVGAAATRWAGPRAGWAAGALAAATGLFTFHEALILQAALDPFLCALALFLLARALPDGGAGCFALAGAAMGLLALNRPNALACAAVIAVALPFRRASGRGWARAAAFAAGAALAIAPATLRNLAVSGEPVLIASHGGLNFYIGNHAEADGTYRAVPGITPNVSGQARDATRMAEQEQGRPLTAGEVSRHFTRKAWSWMRSEPRPAATLFLRKLAYVFNEAELALNYSYRYYARDEPTLLRVLVVGPWLLVPLGVTGLLFGPQRREPVYAAWVSFVPAYALSVAAFFVSGRYRLPLLVPLCIGAGCALELPLSARRQPRSRLIAAAACAALFAAVALWPFRLDEGQTAEREHMALWRLDQQREIARWYELQGVAFAQQGRGAEALASLTQSVRLDAESPSAWLNLAVVQAQEGQLAEAGGSIDQALRLRPDYPQALGLRKELERAATDAEAAARPRER